MSTGYQILVMLHLICVIGGFGAVAYNGLYVSLAQRRPGAAGSSAILEVNTLVSGLAELLIYAALVFGVGAVTASNSHGEVQPGLGLSGLRSSTWWTSGSCTAGSGVSNGSTPLLARQVEEASRAHRNEAPELTALAALEKRVALGWGVFNLCWSSAAVYLMVFKPGS